MRAAKVQASLRIRAVSPEPSLLAHTSSESRGTFRQKARSLAPLNGWACAVKVCHDGMLEDTNLLDGALTDSWLLLASLKKCSRNLFQDSPLFYACRIMHMKVSIYTAIRPRGHSRQVSATSVSIRQSKS